MSEALFVVFYEIWRFWEGAIVVCYASVRFLESHSVLLCSISRVWKARVLPNIANIPITTIIILITRITVIAVIVLIRNIRIIEVNEVA